MTSGSGKRIRRRMLTARFDEAEFEVVASAAEKAGLTISSYARQVLLGAPAPRQVRRPPVERRELVRLLGEIGRIGGNVNQLARAVNSGVLIYTGELDAALAGVLESRAAILRALGREP